MLKFISRLKDLALCSLALGANSRAKWRLFWRQTKNLRVRLGLGSYHPGEVYWLDTVYGPLYFRDNFGDITNLVKLIWQGEYRLRRLPQEGAILDIGANIGLAAAWFSHFNPGRKVYCIEPLADNVAMVRRNCPIASVHQVAVGRERGRMTLRVDPHNIMASRVPCRWETSEVEFDVVPLDEFARTHGIDRVALIKMDAEGMEEEILQGATATLARTRQIVMETHGRERHDAVMDLLKQQGFMIDSASFSGSTGLVFASRGPAPGPRPPAPAVSAVVITVESAARLRTCLDALQRQLPAPPAEILVPWDGSHGERTALQRDYPQVQFLPVGTARLTFAQLRAYGIARASGEIVAITEDHFTPAPDWCRQILEAHQAPHAAIGGAVEKQTPDTVLSWAFYLADYLRYLDPREGPSHHLTDGNVTYKRAALLDIRDTWKAEFHENVVHAALAARGQSLWLSPRIVVRQKRHMSLGAAVRDRYAFGRLFGSTRAAELKAAGRLKLTLLCALLPAVLVMRVASHLLRTRRYAVPSLRAFPALLLISTVWAWGEFVGYITARPDRSLTARAS